MKAEIEISAVSTMPMWSIPLTPDWLTAYGTIFAAASAIFIAFLPTIRKLYNKPRPELEFGQHEPFCRERPLRQWYETGTGSRLRKTEAYFVRLRAKNNGKSVAKNCKGKLVSIVDRVTKQEMSDFDPVVLHWAGEGQRTVDINKKEYEYLDLIYLPKDRPTEYEVNAHDPGPYGFPLVRAKKSLTMRVVVYGENFDPIDKEFQLSFDNSWNGVTINY